MTVALDAPDRDSPLRAPGQTLPATFTLTGAIE